MILLETIPGLSGRLRCSQKPSQDSIEDFDLRRNSFKSLVDFDAQRNHFRTLWQITIITQTISGSYKSYDAHRKVSSHSIENYDVDETIPCSTEEFYMHLRIDCEKDLRIVCFFRMLLRIRMSQVIGTDCDRLNPLPHLYVIKI